MGKLHEVIAVEPNLSATHNVISQETLKVLDKPEHFLRVTEQIDYFDDTDAARLNTSSTKDLTTTVGERLRYSFGHSFTNWIDCMAQIGATNQHAGADLVVNGHVLGVNLPATVLLTLEQKLRLKRSELEAVPTLASGPVWNWDEEAKLWRADPTTTYRTQKTLRPIIMHPATKEHPAQVKEITEDRAVAKISRTMFSGAYTSAQKSDALARMDAVIVATKKARQRANRADITKVHVGNAIAKFILDGPKAELLTAEE
jgi:hypothetical protein